MKKLNQICAQMIRANQEEADVDGVRIRISPVRKAEIPVMFGSD